MLKDKLIGSTLQTFDVIKVLGEGALAKVYYGIDTRDGSQVAIKAVSKLKILQNRKIQELVKTEIKILKLCKNQNIIKFIETFSNSEYIFIITEYCNGGDLQEYLNKKQSLTEDQATVFLNHILNGFKGLHQVGAMHRDFKLANVLIHNGMCKIADLGFAKQMFRPTTQTVIGTSLTMAPQVLEQKPYGKEADIWSLGVVFYQMIYGKYPYEAKSDVYILKKIKTGSPNFSKVNISPNCRDFIDRCLQYDPKKRITWNQIYMHPLLEEQESKVKFVYGNTGKSRLKENMSFYRQEISQKHIQYPQKTGQYDLSDVTFRNVAQIKDTCNYNEKIENIKLKKQMQKLYTKYHKDYLLKRNNIMFIFKFIIPYLSKVSHIKANHNICMFIMCKRALIEMNEFYQDVKNKKNIFRLLKFWQNFIISQQYQDITQLLINDINLISSQCISYRCDITVCSKQIQEQFQINQIKSKNFNKLITNIINEYWYLLSDHLQQSKGVVKESLLKILQALHYFNYKRYKNVEEFDRMITLADLNQIQNRIKTKYIRQFN